MLRSPGGQFGDAKHQSCGEEILSKAFKVAMNLSTNSLVVKLGKSLHGLFPWSNYIDITILLQHTLLCSSHIKSVRRLPQKFFGLIKFNSVPS